MSTVKKWKCSSKFWVDWWVLSETRSVGHTQVVISADIYKHFFFLSSRRHSFFSQLNCFQLNFSCCIHWSLSSPCRCLCLLQQTPTHLCSSPSQTHDCSANVLTQQWRSFTRECSVLHLWQSRFHFQCGFPHVKPFYFPRKQALLKVLLALLS